MCVVLVTYSHDPSPQALAAHGGGDVPGWPSVHGGRVCTTDSTEFTNPPDFRASQGGLHKHLATPPSTAATTTI